jgi:hypothetical protein
MLALITETSLSLNGRSKREREREREDMRDSEDKQKLGLVKFRAILLKVTDTNLNKCTRGA